MVIILIKEWNIFHFLKPGSNGIIIVIISNHKQMEKFSFPYDCDYAHDVSRVNQ